jgi:alkylation response protein AidB-like acyl-CoA dehydrogenase
VNDASDVREAYRFDERRLEIIPLEADPANFDAHENIAAGVLERVRAEVKAAGLWAPQIAREPGGLGLPFVGLAALYEEMGKSIFGAVCFNCAAPDDGNMRLLQQVGTPEQKRWWLQPVVDGKVRSAFAMTEPMPGSGSDPAGAMLTHAQRVGSKWHIRGRKWFITGAGAADRRCIRGTQDGIGQLVSREYGSYCEVEGILALGSVARGLASEAPFTYRPLPR